MSIFFVVMLIADAILLAASQARGRQDWADAICDNAMNVCDKPSWLLIGGVIIVALLMLMRIGR